MIVREGAGAAPDGDCEIRATPACPYGIMGYSQDRIALESLEFCRVGVLGDVLGRATDILALVAKRSMASFCWPSRE